MERDLARPLLPKIQDALTIPHKDPFPLAAALREAQEALAGASRQPRHDAELLLRHVLGRDRAWLLANPDAPLTPDQLTHYHALLARRAQHEPVQYILGEQEFYGLPFAVSPAVLIPRPETEHLVEAALSRIPPDTPTRIADVGTGSGILAVTLAHHRPLVHVTALDLSQSALQIAERNAHAHRVADRIRFLHSDLLSAVAGERFEMIVSNPPYVAATERLEPQVADYEPPLALFAGPDGLDIHRRLIPQVWEALAPGGWLLLEIGYGQRAAIAALLAGWQEVSFLGDLQAIPRVACARR